MPAISSHSTATTDKPWDKGPALRRAPNSASALRQMHAWRDPAGDPDLKATYKFPHHATPGGPANLAACRNALARLPQSDIPAGDKSGVEAHIRKHMDDAES